MHLRVRFIGKALEYLNAQGHDDRRYPMQVSPEVIHVGDLVRHPLFPGRNVYVVAREVDLVDRCVTVWLDELPGASRSDYANAAESPFPSSAQTLDD
jgi:hypothetical protein